MKKIKLLVNLALLFVTWNNYSQIISQIDVNTEIFQGKISVLEHTPFDIGNLSNIFDGDFDTIARSANINPMEITLSFLNPVLLSSAKILVGQDGSWKLEGANSLNDLNNQNGSYVLLCENTTIQQNIYDEQSCANQYFKYLKVTVHRTVGDNYVHLRELELHRSFTVSSICILPKNPKLIKFGEHSMKIIAEDANGGTIKFEEFNLTSSNSNVSVDISNSTVKIVGNSIGTAVLEAEFMGFTATTICTVLDDFELEKSEPATVNVALVLQNPDVPSHGNQPFHQVLGWNDPVLLAAEVANSLSEASGYTMNYNIVQTFDVPYFFTKNAGVYVDIDQFAQALIDNNTTYLDDNIFDYRGMLEALDVCELSNNGTIDEVWVYSVPYGGMYESRMAGDNAFSINGPVIENTNCVGLLPVMGFNYEREADLALHSYGHRFESTLKHLFGRWDNTATNKNEWELFTSYNLINLNEGHIGNIHFPVNGTSDYNYDNTNYVDSYHKNWKRYPFIFNEVDNINCSEWGCTQMGYMMWWFSHIPNYKCLNKDEKLNNWWHYVIDFEEAIIETSLIDVCGCNNETLSTGNIEQNTFNFLIFPNPVSDIISIEFESLEAKKVKIQIVDLMGKILIQESIDTIVGENRYKIDVNLLVKGVYFVNILNANGRIISNKLIKL